MTDQERLQAMWGQWSAFKQAEDQLAQEAKDAQAKLEATPEWQAFQAMQQASKAAKSVTGDVAQELREATEAHWKNTGEKRPIPTLLIEDAHGWEFEGMDWETDAEKAEKFVWWCIEHQHAKFLLPDMKVVGEHPDALAFLEAPVIETVTQRAKIFAKPQGK